MDHTRRKKSTSGDSFSFPSTPNQDSDFEFGSLTPDSPSCRTSPADHLFLNGILQPHSFPLFQPNLTNRSVATSRTSSIGSKDSSNWLSSRSNSTNSSCSSARTSSSDSSERRLFQNKMNKGAYNKTTPFSSQQNQLFGCSQRWQYITPVPVLNRNASSKRRRKEEAAKRSKKKKKKKGVVRMRVRFGRRILRWLVMACRECHAMEPSKVKNNNKLQKM